MSIDYLLGKTDDSGGIIVNNYRHILEVIINIFDKKLVEFDDKPGSTGFFCIKIIDEKITSFLIKYMKMLEIQSSIGEKVFF